MPILASALTVAAVGSQLAGAGMSFAEARNQKRRQREAEATAEKYMAQARKSLEKNYMESLAIQKEPYELEREAALSAGAQATEALRESDRGAGRVGAIYGQQQQAQRQIAAAMGQELFNLDYLTAQEESRLRDIGTQLDLGEVTGAQLAAANAEERRQQQLQAGVQAIGSAAMTGLDAMALYGKQKAPQSNTLMEGLAKSGDTPQDRLNVMVQQQPQIQGSVFQPNTQRRVMPDMTNAFDYTFMTPSPNTPSFSYMYQEPTQYTGPIR